VDAIPTTYVKNSDLTTLVTQIVNQINSGGNTVVQNYSKMVPYTVVAYFGPLSNFDAYGIGVTSLGFEKIYMCNGSNGTPDLRGRTIVGAVRNVPGGVTLDAAVDPANPNNPNWAANDKRGENTNTLISSQMPVHSHAVNDPGHLHKLSYSNAIHAKDAGSTLVLSLGTNPISPRTIADTTETSTTGITLGSTGGGQPHNNIQPSLSGYYIMYIP
jgi:microcystin-dependent protein